MFWTKRFPILILIAIAHAFMTATAMGQGSEKGMTPLPGKGAEKKYTYWVLTPDDLKVCVDLGSRMTTLRGEIPEMDKKIAKQEEELKTLKTKMDKMKPAVGIKVDLADYNKTVDAFNTQNTAYGQDLRKYKESVEKHNQAMEDYKKHCAGRSFYQEDYNQMFGGGN
jgi:ABC-type Fe3+-citrate transport system substrate-binding protein